MDLKDKKEILAVIADLQANEQEHALRLQDVVDKLEDYIANDMTSKSQVDDYSSHFSTWKKRDPKRL